VRSALVAIAVALPLAVLGCKSADKGKAGEPGTSGADARVVEARDKPETVRADGVKPGGVKPDDVKPDGVKPDDPVERLPADLAELAEMPALTAEATEAEINRRVDRYLEVVSAFFEVIAEHSDCQKMGESLGRFADANASFLRTLSDKTSDPAVSKRFGELLTKRGGDWMKKIGDNLARCAQHPTVLAALMKMSQQQQQ
jgi:hypothetical protein